MADRTGDSSRFGKMWFGIFNFRLCSYDRKKFSKALPLSDKRINYHFSTSMDKRGTLCLFDARLVAWHESRFPIPEASNISLTTFYDSNRDLLLAGT